MSTNTGTAKKGKLSGKGSNLALQAGILAGAGIVSRIIGLLYRSPLYQILGDEGMDIMVQRMQYTPWS